MTGPPRRASAGGQLAVGRRRFLLGALGVGGFLLGRSLASGLLVPPPSGGPVERLARLLEHRESARIVGREYLLAAPEEANPEVLVSLVAERLQAPDPSLSGVGDRELRRMAALGVLADFEEGRTVKLDGWVLSETEARLCALAACGPSVTGGVRRAEVRATRSAARGRG